MAHTLQEYSANDDHVHMLTSQTACICCLAQNVPLILLTTCKHTGFLHFLNRTKVVLQNCAVCYLCHGMMKKIELFMQQVQNSCAILNGKTSSYNKFEFFQYTPVSLLSVDPEDSPQPESVKEYQQIGVEEVDPPYMPRNVLKFERSQALEVNHTDSSLENRGKIVTAYTEFARNTHEDNLIASNKCIKCQILYDEITLSDLVKTNQLPNTYVCESCNLECNNQLAISENSILPNASNTIKLERNTTELHTLCQKESCHPDTYHSHYDNEYNDNAYDDDGNDNEYFENGVECLLHINNESDQSHDDEEKNITNGEKKKKRKKERSGFKKTILSLEEQKAELEAKRKEKKYLDAEFKCYNCALGFLFKDTYQAHMMRHEESNGEHKCVTCSLRFASPAVLRAHAHLHAARATCRRCGVLASPRRLRHHAATCRGGDVPCHLCAAAFRDASGLQQHLKRFHQSKTSMRSYSCSVCGKNYNNQAAVRTHMIKHLNRNFSCDRCSSTFSSPYTLNQHKKKHDAEPEQHYCEVCKIGYASRKSLLAHKRNALVHQQTVFECPVCHRVCPNQRALSSHMTTVHSTTKDHACDTCGARYTSRKSLVRHIASHNRQPVDETHACHRCPRTFKSRSKLNRHLRLVCEKDKLEEELSCYYGEGMYTVKE